MKRGQRPSKHTRRVRTKTGRRRVRVNPHIKKKKSVKFKKVGIITVKDRKLFKHLSDPKIYGTEFGGAIDFDLTGKIEQINVSPGKEDFVDLPPDYEIQWHSHPDYVSPPSHDDIIALIENRKQQAEIVFRNGEAFIIYKSPQTKALSKLSATQLRKKLGGAFFASSTETQWLNYLRKLGFVVVHTKKLDKPLYLKVRLIEPKKKKKVKL